MIDLSFVLGLALGTIVTGFCAIGSFNRGFDSVRRRSWSTVHAARKRAVVASRTALRTAARPAAKGAVARAS
jgi:hypothetical protein